MVLLLVALASFADRACRSASTSPPAAEGRARYDRRAGTVANIVNGDTLDVAIDRGETVRVRLLGIDAPDDADLGAKAVAYLTARANGKPITLRLDELSRPGETLAAYVYLADNDLLNDAIVRDGWAFAYRAEPCDFSGQFEVSENAARSAKRGLWRTITVDQMPAWRRKWLADRGLK